MYVNIDYFFGIYGEAIHLYSVNTGLNFQFPCDSNKFEQLLVADR